MARWAEEAEDQMPVEEADLPQAELQPGREAVSQTEEPQHPRQAVEEVRRSVEREVHRQEEGFSILRAA